MVLVGLACKNAILIVEFARELEFQGVPVLWMRLLKRPFAFAPHSHDIVCIRHGCCAAGYF